MKLKKIKKILENQLIKRQKEIAKEVEKHIWLDGFHYQLKLHNPKTQGILKNITE